MAHFWIRQQEEWAVVPLQHGAAVPAPLRLSDLRRAAGEHAPAHEAVFMPGSSGGNGRTDWHLMTRSRTGVLVNGQPVVAGLRTLADRDEIRVRGAAPMYFSTERIAGPGPMPETGHPVSCPRCRQLIVPGTIAVQCPACDLWHHAADELPCWTYADRCALCSQSTSPDAGFLWTPEQV